MQEIPTFFDEEKELLDIDNVLDNNLNQEQKESNTKNDESIRKLKNLELHKEIYPLKLEFNVLDSKDLKELGYGLNDDRFTREMSWLYDNFADKLQYGFAEEREINDGAMYLSTDFPNEYDKNTLSFIFYTKENVMSNDDINFLKEFINKEIKPTLKQDIENAREEMAIQKEYEKIVKECEEQEKDFSFGSANHQEFIEEQNIKDIESTDFYKSDMWDKVERFSAYEKEANEELEENKKRQEKIEEELNNRKENEQENQNNKERQFTKEDVKHKSTEDLEKELKNLKFRERELKNDLSETRREIGNEISNILEAKDINQLITALLKIFQRMEQRRIIKYRLKHNKDSIKLSKAELKQLKLLKKITKDMQKALKNEDNINTILAMQQTLVESRKESSKELQENKNNKKLSKEFENLMKDYERNKGNPKRQDNILNSFENLFTKNMQGEKSIAKSFEKTHQEQFKKINEFFTKNIKNRDFTKTKEKEVSMGRAM